MEGDIPSQHTDKSEGCNDKDARAKLKSSSKPSLNEVSGLLLLRVYLTLLLLKVKFIMQLSECVLHVLNLDY